MRCKAMLVAVAVLVGTMVVPAGGHAGEDYDVRVRVGATPPDGAPVQFSYTRFYPDHVRVRRGQTVLFDNVEQQLDLHTVSFWEGGEAARPPLVRQDEGEERFAVNEIVFRRSDCGSPGQASCVVDGSGTYLNSGLAILSDPEWRVTVDAPAGTTITYFCQVLPWMTGSIEVVDDATPLPSQDQIDAEVSEQIALDTQEAIDHREMREGELVRRIEDGRSIWRVLAGDTTPSGHVSILDNMPSHLEEASPGDAVEFEVFGHGHHSVTFPMEVVGDKAIGPGSRLSSFAFHPACDLDDPETGLPGIGGPWAPFSPVPCPGSFELVLTPWVSAPNRAPGDQVATAATYHDSGLMFAEDMPEAVRGRPAGSGVHFPHVFTAEFPVVGTFSYGCTIHGADTMAGTVVVR